VLRVAEQWHDSDLGRQRQGNEDNYFVQSPLFVVADGMGGAQAGEVASEVAVTAFASGLPSGSPAEGLVRVVEDANRRIHEMSRAERQKAGMGTTLTAAYVTEDDEVVVAHVGDSRCYLLRDGDLVRLTRDHSLVGELVARGKLTEEQAEQHPQRSVITRALGPEPTVQVDVDVLAARDGDLFLLCSDGLTSMVPEQRIGPILLGERSLERAGNALISAANEAGGRDNITVILFRLEAVETGARGSDADTTEHAVAGETDESGEAGEQPTRHAGDAPATGDVAAAVRAADAAEAESRRPGAVALDASSPTDGRRRTAPLAEAATGKADPPTRGPAPGRRRRWRPRAGFLLVTILGFSLLFAAWSASRAVYFVGTDVDDGRTITIFRGLPYELVGGVRLYERYAGSGVTLEQVPEARRRTFTDHKLRSLEDAEDLVTALERGRLNQ
jgi:protein phosphatase